MKRSVAVTQPARLKLESTMLCIQIGDDTHFVPIEDLSILVLDHDAIDLTGPLLGQLGEQGVAVLICNTKHLPSMIALPYEGHTLMPSILRRQIEIAKPLKKRLWQTLIQAKIESEGRHLLKETGKDHGFMNLARTVQSGDTTNREGLSAAYYFEAIFGEQFIRLRGKQLKDTEADLNRLEVINVILNYGYAVLRACVARAVVLAGMHPALGIFHRNRENSFALADDLMEPLRVLVNRLVVDRIRTTDDWPPDLTPELKRHMLQVLTAEVGWDGGTWPLDAALEAYAAGVRSWLFRETNRIAVPIA